MCLVIKDVEMPYHIHSVDKKEEPRCAMCDSGIEVQKRIATPVFFEGEFSYMMLCEKDSNKLIRRIKYRWFFEIINKLKSSIKRLISFVKRND